MRAGEGSVAKPALRAIFSPKEHGGEKKERSESDGSPVLDQCEHSRNHSCACRERCCDLPRGGIVAAGQCPLSIEVESSCACLELSICQRNRAGKKPHYLLAIIRPTLEWPL